MSVFRPLPRVVTRPISILILIAWVAVMAVLVNRSYLQASSATLATDLARYGSAAVWRGVYYRGEKIGFTVSQTLPTDDGFELEEDGRLQMSLLGATTPATIRTTAHVDRTFPLQLVRVLARSRHRSDRSQRPARRPRLTLAVTTAGTTRTEVRDLPEPPALSLNLSRRLANGGLVAGARHQWTSSIPRRCATRRSSSTSASASSCAGPARRRFRRSASRWNSPACGRRRG